MMSNRPVRQSAPFEATLSDILNLSFGRPQERCVSFEKTRQMKMDTVQLSFEKRRGLAFPKNSSSQLTELHFCVMKVEIRKILLQNLGLSVLKILGFFSEYHPEFYVPPTF